MNQFKGEPYSFSFVQTDFVQFLIRYGSVWTGLSIMFFRVQMYYISRWTSIEWIIAGCSVVIFFIHELFDPVLTYIWFSRLFLCYSHVHLLLRSLYSLSFVQLTFTTVHRLRTIDTHLALYTMLYNNSAKK